jgi:hypothetical protein
MIRYVHGGYKEGLNNIKTKEYSYVIPEKHGHIKKWGLLS